MGKYDDKCDWCGAFIGDGEALDKHEGRHPGAAATLRISADQSRAFHPHADSCNCRQCQQIRESIKREKKAYAEGLRA